jgi:hypothetical protein
MCMLCDVEERSLKHCCTGNAISVTYSECVSVALGTGTQSACAILSSVACPALQYFFPHYLINGTIFEKKLLNTKCVF